MGEELSECVDFLKVPDWQLEKETEMGQNYLEKGTVRDIR